MAQVSFAQQDVYLNISHFLGTTPFSFNSVASNNIGNDFKVTRLEYYISEITLTHDGGQQTKVDDLWILVNAGTPVNEFLGSLNVTALESVSFGIGVEQAYNHLDPASYPMTHPLSPKSPSMHWGWTPGYRFVAFEGKAGANLNLTFEIHALGDGNYFHPEIVTAGKISGSNLEINLDANYSNALSGINVSSGPISHGETGISVDALVNFSNSVFTESNNSPTGINNISQQNSFTVAPNPTNRMVSINSEIEGFVDVRVVNILGKEVRFLSGVQAQDLLLNLDSEGLYFVNLYQNGNLIGTQRVSVIK